MGARRRPVSRRKLLRCNYTETWMPDFIEDMQTIYAEYTEEIRRGDRQAHLKAAAIRTVVAMLVVLAVLIPIAIMAQIPWWIVALIQTVTCAAFFARSYDDTEAIVIYREADRRGVTYDRKRTPLYEIMNAINKDHNTLWNKKFVWQ